MPTIYERVAVCSDTTWNALDAAEQATYDFHYTTWANYLASTKSNLVTINQGCREVVIWCDETMPLPRYNPTAGQLGTEDSNNHNILKAHETARHNGNINATGVIKFDGFSPNSNYTLWDGIVFDQSLSSDTTIYFCDCLNKNHKFENCIFKDLVGATRQNTYGYFKNCIYYDFSGYITAANATFYNCGFYTTIAYTQQRVIYASECYSCWAYSANRTGSYLMFDACTGANCYATDGSTPIAPRTLSTFGFTDPANGDFSITSSSPLFDAGLATGQEASTDIAGNPRSQGGKIDIGPFELAVQTTVTLEGLVIGSAVSIVDLDNGGFIVPPFAADATTETMEFSLSASTHVSVRVRNASGATKYQPWSSDFLLTSAGATLYVSQIEDLIA